MTEESTFLETPTKHVEWKLTNFLDLPMGDYCIESPRFSLYGTKWYLSIYPNGDKENVGWICLDLHKEDSTLECSVSCRMGIKDCCCTEIGVKEYTVTFSTEYLKLGFYLVKRSTVQCSKRTYLSPEGTLTVFCAVRIEDQQPISSNVETASQTYLPDGDSNLLEDFKNMYISGNYTDVVILVKNKKLCAHRSVLASRSAVFASMFQHNFAEKRSGKVEISDCDPDLFEKFLLFLYTGKLERMSSNKAADLYKIADKYDVKQLKEQCVEVMCSDLCVDSFFNVVQLATMHFESDLLKMATDFFIENVKTILQTTEWLQFSEKNLILSNELVMNFVKSKK